MLPESYQNLFNDGDRKERRHSSFYLGCHGVDWLDRRDILEELVESLMRLTPNKYLYYHKGYIFNHNNARSILPN